MTLPFGIDISKYQDPATINYDEIAKQVDFVILRIGFGWAKDIYFERHYLAFTERGVRIGVYHFPLNTRLQEQANLVKQALDGKRIEAGLWVDVEAQYQSRSEINAYIPILESTIGAEVGIYTSYSKWLEIMQNETRWASRRLWVANYGVSVPRLPSPWKKWCVWQYSSTGRLNGYSGNLDLDWADADCLNAIPVIGNAVPADPPVTETPLFRVRIVTVKPNKYRVYKAVNGEVYPRDTHWLDSGDERDVYQVQGDWYRIGAGQWIRNTQWVVIVGETPPTFDGTYFGAVYWQKDPRWKDIKLGNSNLTIGSDGCLVTNFAMVFGVTPAEFNARMKEVGGFTGALVYWQMVKKAYPNSEYVRAIDCYYVPAPLKEIDALLAQNIPVMVQVDYNPKTAAMDQHWVLIIGKNGDDYIINDPIDGKRGSFRAKYGDPARWIFRIRAYRKVNA